MGILTVLATKTLGTTEKVVLNRYAGGMLEFIPYTATSGTTTNLSTTLASVTSTLGWRAGMAISGTGIPAGATIVSFVADTSAVLSAAATASATVTVTVTKTPTTGPCRTQSSAVEASWVRKLYDALSLVA